MTYKMTLLSFRKSLAHNAEDNLYINQAAQRSSVSRQFFKRSSRSQNAVRIIFRRVDGFFKRFFCLSDLVLARQYNVSSATLVTIGLEVTEKLTAEVKVYLSNRNDLHVELTPEVLKSLKQEET